LRRPLLGLRPCIGKFLKFFPSHWGTDNRTNTLDETQWLS
jgi:hypothetical protein